MVSIKDVFTSNELDEIINKGVLLGLERAKDENIELDIDYHLSNGEDNNIEEYKKRLNNNSLNDYDKKIINKYKEL